MFFGIRSQHEKLKIRREQLILKATGLEIPGIEGFAKAKTEMNDACDLVYSRIKTTKEKIRAYLPWTKAYRLRAVAAERLTAFNKKLNELEFLISIAVPKKQPRSTSVIEEVKVFKSPIGYPSGDTKMPLVRSRSAPAVLFALRSGPK